VHHGLAKINTHVDANAPMIEKKVLYEFFDEGVTDLIALEMAQAYLQNYPDISPAENMTKIFDTYQTQKQKLWHGRAMHQVQKFMDHLSQSTGLDRTIVWQAIKRGNFGTENIHDEKIREMLKAELPPDLFAKTFPLSKKKQ
jgi:hypothetical protein